MSFNKINTFYPRILVMQANWLLQCKVQGYIDKFGLYGEMKLQIYQNLFAILRAKC